ncbi:MAG TPA: leucyl aminopeptidase [Candidatus Hydrogenedens sp.]|nr:leucyl aminopeptidase [Candidatus Hydrogenedens sp.]
MIVSVVHPQMTIEWNWNTTLLIPIFENELPVDCELLTEDQEIIIQSMIDRDLFYGKDNEFLFVPFPDAAFAGALLVGLGKQDKINLEKVRRISAQIFPYTKANKITHLVCDWERLSPEYMTPFIEGIFLAQYTFEQYKNQEKKESNKPIEINTIIFIVSTDKDISVLNNQCGQTVLICNAVAMARSLTCSPANELTPQTFADIAKNVCKDTQIKVRVLNKIEMEKEGLNCILSVGKGSKNEPLLLVLEYQPEMSSEKPLVIIGKGVTFDTGGICLKPRDDMHEMRYDMSGAATVLGTIYALNELKSAVSVVGIIPLVENMPGGSALLPGDIIKTYSGKTVEVLNTDAEGRLILADAISYVQKNYSPQKIVDIATLTGGCIIALGHFAAGLLGNNNELIQELTQAGEQTGERLWTLPIWEDYDKLIQSDFADIANIGPKSDASTIIGAVFLKQFVENNTPWAHIDIAGTAWGVKHIPYWDTKYPTGFGVRLLTCWLLKHKRENK